MELLLLFLVLLRQTIALDEIRARVLVQYHPWDSEDRSRGVSGVVNIHRTNKILSNVPGSDVVLEEDILKHGVVLLECFANVPVVWDYEGYGYPSVATTGRTGRKFANFTDRSTYTYWTKVHLAQANEKNTGKYFCKSVKQPEMNIYFYIYVPGFSFFVPPSGMTVNVGEQDAYLHIPCVISHPSDLLTDLYKLNVNGHPELMTRARFDPKGGFLMDITNDIHPWGTYICVGGNKTMMNSFVAFAKRPKELIVRVTVNSSFVPLRPQIKQHFICAALQNVTFQFDPPLQLNNSKISYSYNPDSEFPFEVELLAEPEEFEGHRFIRCVHSDVDDSPLYPNLATDDVLHTWEYSAFGNNRSLSFQYNSTLEAFICCTADSYARPSDIYFIPCSTYQECLLRSYIDPSVPHVHRQPREFLPSMHHYSDPKSRIDHHLIPPGCIGVEQFLENHQGLFWCRSRESEAEPSDFRVLCNDCDAVPTLEPMKISHESPVVMTTILSVALNNMSTNVEVSCEYNRFHASNGIQWAVRSADGSTYLLPSSSIHLNQKEPKTWAVKLPENSGEIACLVPRWDSDDWEDDWIEIKK